MILVLVSFWLICFGKIWKLNYWRVEGKSNSKHVARESIYCLVKKFICKFKMQGSIRGGINLLNRNRKRTSKTVLIVQSYCYVLLVKI